MKNIVGAVALLLGVFTFAQEGFGVKAGLTFNADEGLIKTLDNTYQAEGEGSVGYHLGIYKRINLTGLYVQPELMYVNFKNEFNDGEGDSFDVKYKRIDVPVSVGTDVFGLAFVQAGPVFSYYFEDDIDLDQVSEVEQDDISLALQIGAGVQLQDLSINLRYDFPLGDRQTEWVQDNDWAFQTESSPKLLHLSLGYSF